MGLSRNKVAVSEGAAGSPPFYGERENMEVFSNSQRKQKKTTRNKALKKFVVRFSGTVKKSHEYGGVAQLGEHLPCKQGVKGSIPFISTNGEKKRRRTKTRCLGRLTNEKGS